MGVKVAILTFLYFVQGLPYGFQDKVIPIYLRSQGLSYTELSFTKLLLIPWFCKAFFAPLVDNCLTHSRWLHISLFSLGLTSILTGTLLCQSLVGLSIALFWLNVFTAVQDISVDALALNILGEEELGYGNTAQVVGYKLGSIFGGGVLFMIQIQYGLPTLFVALAVAYFGASFIYKCVQLTVSSSTNQITSRTDKQSLSFVNVLRCFQGLFTSETLSIAIFILVYKLGEAGIFTTFPVYLIDQGVNKSNVVFWNNFVGQTVSLCGSAYGGTLIHNSKLSFPVLRKYCSLRILPVIASWVLVYFWSFELHYYLIDAMLSFLSFLTLIVLQFVGGVISTVTFSMMMVCSQSEPENMRATHYSSLASLEVFGKLMFVSFIGTALDSFGFSTVYFLLAFLTILPVLLVPENNTNQSRLKAL